MIPLGVATFELRRIVFAIVDLASNLGKKYLGKKYGVDCWWLSHLLSAGWPDALWPDHSATGFRSLELLRMFLQGADDFSGTRDMLGLFVSPECGFVGVYLIHPYPVGVPGVLDNVKTVAPWFGCDRHVGVWHQRR